MRVALGIAVFLVSSAAAASEPGGRWDSPPPVRLGHGGGFKLPSDRDGGLLRFEAFTTGVDLDPLAVNGTNTPRRLVGVPTAPGSARLYGVGAALELRSNWLVFAAFQVRYAGSGDSSQGTARANEESVVVKRGAVHLLEIGLPTLAIPSGFQVAAASDWKVRIDLLDWGLSRLWTSAVVTDASGGGGGGDITRWGVYWRWSVAGCRGLGTWATNMHSWLCAFAAPTVYDQTLGWFHGVSIGARAEL